MNLKPLTVKRVVELFTLEELTVIGDKPNFEMFGRLLTKAVVAQRDQDQEVMADLYEALKYILGVHPIEPWSTDDEVEIDRARQALAKVNDVSI